MDLSVRLERWQTLCGQLWDNAERETDEWQQVLAMMDAAVLHFVDCGSVPKGGWGFLWACRRHLWDRLLTPTKQDVEELRSRFVALGVPVLAMFTQ